MKYGGSRFVEEGDHETWFSNTVQPLEHLYAVESSSLLQTHLNTASGHGQCQVTPGEEM